MKKISTIVKEIIENDDIARIAASRGLLNAMAYARNIHDEVERKTHKTVQLGSIATTVSRQARKTSPIKLPPDKDIQQISVQTNLAGLTYERSEEVSERIRKIYNKVNISNKTYITITQGINEITIIAEHSVIETFKKELSGYNAIYDISNIVGITVKFDLKYMEIPNLFYVLIRKMAMKNINVIELISTATELTFIIDKEDASKALSQLQKNT